MLLNNKISAQKLSFPHTNERGKVHFIAREIQGVETTRQLFQFSLN